MDSERVRQALGQPDFYRPLTAEQKLMTAILARALADVLRGTEKMEGTLARRWLSSYGDEDSYTLSLKFVLESVVDDAEAAKNAILKIINDPNYDATQLLGTYGFNQTKKKSLRAKTS